MDACETTQPIFMIYFTFFRKTVYAEWGAGTTRKVSQYSWLCQIFSFPIMWVFSEGRVCIIINDVLGTYFQTRKGLGQGDPFRLYFFEITAHVLVVLVKRDRENGIIKGFPADLLDEGLAIIQYADDAIFMFKDGLESARNLIFILCVYEHLIGLKIDFNKSEVSFFSNAVEKKDIYAHIFTCKIGIPL